MILKDTVYKVVTRVIPKRPATLRILRGPLAGQSFRANYSIRPQYILGTYELGAVDRLRSLLKPGDCAYDVGANAGYFACVMAKMVGTSGLVYAFEPSPVSYPNLAVNAELIRPYHVEPVQMGICDQVGEEEFTSFDYDLISGLGNPWGRRDNADVIRVKVSTLDHFVYEQGHRPPNLIKMDVEGAELRALAGMKRVLAEAKPIVILEAHGSVGPEPVREFFSSVGYRCEALDQADHMHLMGTPQLEDAAVLSHS